MATVRLLLGIFCLVVCGRLDLPRRSFLAPAQRFSEAVADGFANPEAERVLAIARTQIGVTELTGNNDGKAVTRYLESVGLPVGQPWCAAFISWVFAEAGYSAPRTGWSPALFPLTKRKSKAFKGAVFGVYFPSLKRIAHVGLLECIEGEWLVTIEGNTNQEGSREGEGVYRKRRPISSIRFYADWLR